MLGNLALLHSETKPQILVIDDEAVVRDCLCRWLSSEGYETRSACCGSEALDIVRKGGCDLALIDIELKGMSGLELQERLAETESNPAVIIVTGIPSEETAARALAGGAYEYLTKPVDPERLSRLVAGAMERRFQKPFV